MVLRNDGNYSNEHRCWFHTLNRASFTLGIRPFSNHLNFIKLQQKGRFFRKPYFHELRCTNASNLSSSEVRRDRIHGWGARGRRRPGQRGDRRALHPGGLGQNDAGRMRGRKDGPRLGPRWYECGLIRNGQSSNTVIVECFMTCTWNIWLHSFMHVFNSFIQRGSTFV